MKILAIWIVIMIGLIFVFLRLIKKHNIKVNRNDEGKSETTSEVVEK